MSRGEQIIRNIKLAELLGKPLNGDSKRIKDFIDGILFDLVKFEMNECENSIFYKKDDIVFFEKDCNFDWLCCDYDNYWLVLNKDFGCSDQDVQKITKFMVCDYLNCRYLNVYDIVYNLPSKSKLINYKKYKNE